VDDELVYLSSLESYRFGPVRECRILEILTFDTGKPAVRAAVDPPVSLQELGRVEDVSEVVLTTRHEGASIAPVDEFPCFVFIAIPRQGASAPRSPVRADDLEIIAWGELYRSRADAAATTFG
jgi:hypothetical protein